jgi:hypothetical protein
MTTDSGFDIVLSCVSDLFGLPALSGYAHIIAYEKPFVKALLGVKFPKKGLISEKLTESL